VTDVEAGSINRVRIRRQWNDWRTAIVSLDSIDGLHWSSVSGGVQQRSPRPFLHAYVRCDQILEGELAHSCLHGTAPHRVKICIVKKDNPKVFQVLEKIAGIRPSRTKTIG
jgi:hypothetical protein